MQATYDKEADAMYIRLKKGKINKTLRVSEGVQIYIDSRGRALGIEMLFVYSQFPRNEVQKTVRTGIPVSLVAA